MPSRAVHARSSRVFPRENYLGATLKLKKIEPAFGQESVWDYPRPPALEAVSERLRVEHAGQIVAETQAGYRVIETSHPPVYYFPPDDVRTSWLMPEAGTTTACEYKGRAQYWTLVVADREAPQAAWSYPNPMPRFKAISGYLAFYASSVDTCRVGPDIVQPQDGDFYGGWITHRIVGPFKGGPGTWGW
ncbi:MAG: hypothetical protein ACI9W2_002745 [Gammaproteobacteria bacterium]|jgi:uncharacterized protein (DUF427 family)